MKYKKALLLGLFVVSGFSALEADAQKAPDNDVILEEISNADSPYYYTSLMMRYETGDPALTLEDYRHLYYGYPWQDTYKPFDNNPAQDRILEFFDVNPDLESLNTAKLHELTVYAEELLKTEPFNPATLNMLAYAYGRLNDTVNEKKNYNRMQGVVKAIMSTGDGLTESSAWHVLYFTHANDIMGILRKNHRKAEVATRTVQFVPFTVPDGKIKGYYFDYSRIYWFRPDNLPEKRSKGWSINGMPLKKD